MHISERDKALFRLICRHNMLSTKQIHREIFPALELTTVARRLRRLEERGLLKRLGKLYSGANVWGNSQAANDHATGFFSSSRTNLHTLEHDVTISEVQLLLEKITTVDEWFDSRHMRSSAISHIFKENYSDTFYGSNAKDELIPDGLFEALSQGKKRSFSLEVELSIKANSRYIHLGELYAYRNPPEFIFYVVRDMRIRNAVFAGAERYSSTAKRLFLAFLPELLIEKENTKVHMADGSSYLLKHFFGPTSHVPEPVHLLAHQVDKQVDSSEGRPQES